jgi:hypothetical protein
MCANISVSNKSKIVTKTSLKKVILENFTLDSGYFYSIEVTPKEDLHCDFNNFKILPLFVAVTWIKNENLKAKSLFEAPAFDLARKIESSQVVNSVTCYNLIEENLDEILTKGQITNLTILRGGM